MFLLVFNFKISFFRHNLTFALPTKNHLYLNWPFPVTARDVRPARGPPDVLVDHAVLDEDAMRYLSCNN